MRSIVRLMQAFSRVEAEEMVARRVQISKIDVTDVVHSPNVEVLQFTFEDSGGRIDVVELLTLYLSEEPHDRIEMDRRGGGTRADKDGPSSRSIRSRRRSPA